MKSYKLDNDSIEFKTFKAFWSHIQKVGRFDNGDVGTDAEWQELIDRLNTFCNEQDGDVAEFALQFSTAWLEWLNFKQRKAKGLEKEYNRFKMIKQIVRKEDGKEEERT